MNKVTELKEKLAKIDKAIASPATPASQKETMKKVKMGIESQLKDAEVEEAKAKESADKKAKEEATKKASAKKAKPAVEKLDETTTIDGKKYSLADCEEMFKAWEARKKQAQESNHAYKTKPVTQKVADNVETAVKQAADGVSKSRMENEPKAVAKGADMIKKAVEDLFKGFEQMTGKKVSEKQRKEILAILLEVKEEAKENM